GTITSYFGPRWGSIHTAIDIAAPTGTPILAADSGMVVYRGYNGNYGYMLKIDHGGGRTVTWYAHLSAYNVNLGDTVNKGDVIGYVGNTGFSTGPHLHYEVHVDGEPVDPLNFYQ
ncbi:MAG TPA: M23 family metallopeptidase, partial [Symbiobacteriaceae bacterium]|nr:M23 family metallopeptidase [Symbiobacteriaceae bacterium]